MTRLEKLKKETGVSDYVMAVALDIHESYYREIEKVKESTLSPYIKEKVDNLCNNKGIIDKIKATLSNWVSAHANDDVLKLYNVTVEQIADAIDADVTMLNNFLHKGKQMPKNIEDRFIDYMVYLDFQEQDKKVRENETKDMCSQDTMNQLNITTTNLLKYKQLTEDLLNVVKDMHDIL